MLLPSSSIGSLAFAMENPFSLKVGQVFTGFGVGCGIGIGVGQPIPFGSVPALQQVLSATRGATDPFLGVARYFNVYLKKLGLKSIEAGIGCGVGIGHGFGVGLALKPRVVHEIQSSFLQAVAKIMMNLGITPSLSSVQSVIPGPLPSSISMLSGTSGRNLQTSTGTVLDLASKTAGSTFQYSTSYESFNQNPTENYESKETPSEISLGTRSEKVINTFLQNPPFKNEEEMELNELAGNLRSENNLLQVLLKHQQAIEELMEENRKLRQIVVEDLKVSPSKLQASHGSSTRSFYPCSDCFECRRRRRKSAR